jgi:uncharacterized membrane protein
MTMGDFVEPHKVIVSTEIIALSLEFLGVVVITLSFIHAIVRSLMHFRQRKEDAYELLRTYLGKALLVGLEFFVAADIIRTVLIEPTMESIVSLGMLIIVRTFLGWSISVEIEGCWPWQMAQIKKG